MKWPFCHARCDKRTGRQAEAPRDKTERLRAPGRGGNRPGSSAARCGTRGSGSRRRSAAARCRRSRRSRPGPRASSAGLRTVWCEPPASQPGLDRGREVGPRPVQRPGHGQARQGLFGRNDVDLVGHQPEPVAKVGQRRDERGPRRGVENQPDGVRARADRQGMDLAARLAARRSTGRPRACARPAPSPRPERGRTCSPP